MGVAWALAPVLSLLVRVIPVPVWVQLEGSAGSQCKTRRAIDYFKFCLFLINYILVYLAVLKTLMEKKYPNLNLFFCFPFNEFFKLVILPSIYSSIHRLVIVFVFSTFHLFIQFFLLIQKETKFSLKNMKLKPFNISLAE